MSKTDDIAIVIPVYKSDFLEESLESVVTQTDLENCRIYIFNDASEDTAIEPIVRSFSQSVPTTYHRFEQNMGKISLPAQWNRCIRQTGGERWVWLFSDDDVMDPACLQNFRSARAAYPQTRLFRFDTVKFKDEIPLRRNSFPKITSALDFAKLKLGYKQESYAVEYLFERDLFDGIGGFPEYPLGWCADDLFWIKAAGCVPMVTIPDALVYWRYSEVNISGSENTARSACEKMRACLMFIDEVQRIGRIATDRDTIRLLFEWILGQWAYLKNYMDTPDADRFHAEICSSHTRCFR